MAESTENKCMNLSYDVLTIFISIADIATDIIVLIGFYLAGRDSFFALSLIILIIAQIAYSSLFMWRFRVFPEKGFVIGMLVFFLLLPFGSIVSFIVYFTDDKDSIFARFFADCTGLDVDYSLQNRHLRGSHSQLHQWIIKSKS